MSQYTMHKLVKLYLSQEGVQTKTRDVKQHVLEGIKLAIMELLPPGNTPKRARANLLIQQERERTTASKDRKKAKKA